MSRANLSGMNPVPGYPLGVPPAAAIPFTYTPPFPVAAPEPVFGPRPTMMPGFNRVPT